MQQGSQHLDTQKTLASCPAPSSAPWPCLTPPPLTWGSGFFVGLAISRRASAPQTLSWTRSWRSLARRGSRSPSSLGKCLVHSQGTGTRGDCSHPEPQGTPSQPHLGPLLQAEDTPGQGDPRAPPARPAQRRHCSAPRGPPPGQCSTARGAAGTQTGPRRHPGPEWTPPASPPQRTSLPLCSPVSGGVRSASQPGTGTKWGTEHGAQAERGSKPEDRALTVLQSSNGRKPAKKGAKASPPAAAARAGMASPACSSNMASYSACRARSETGGASHRTPPRLQVVSLRAALG